ncbi:alpha/beta fold hydrolase [Thiobaca trueperi]|uniref:Pimeloyl-ACP methyl ester carboxylesterase n=1 Tax=Thiobaca trueperi TaxID=127458 RepID=A0A4R3NAN4_9GAMM|nr:alpha/beta fold hydrolase [Thiobaca trueperi]TCT24213.1 pimeloyl-ACP methyl ester carboxylesterase [Thiobaca trueperi]
MQAMWYSVVVCRAGVRSSLLLAVGILLLVWGLGYPVCAGADAGSCPIQTAQATLDGGTLHYSQAGAGTGPPVMLLHGLFAQKEQWNALLCQLAAVGYTAIAPDLPGYGQSVPFALPDYRLARQVELLRQFIDSLGLGRIDLAGNSMGGAIAALYARSDPQRVRSLALIGAPFGLTDWSPQVQAAIEDGVNPFVPVDLAQFDLEMGLLFVNPPVIPDAVKAALVADYVEHNRFYQQVWNIVSLDARSLESGVTSWLPTLVLWGQDDRIFAAEDGARHIRRRFPRARLIQPAATGHLPHLEQPAETAQRYLDFLATRRSGWFDRDTQPSD